jgi:DNA-binding XRE family transcriptional regulator
VSVDTPVQRIKVGGQWYVLMAYEEYEAHARSANQLSRGFLTATDAKEITGELPNMPHGSSSLRVWRKHLGLTLDELAANVGMSKSFLSEVETGKRTGRPELWSKLARALGTSIEEILPKQE